MYLDARGLCALWREGLLAKQVLAGRTRGYRRHPQLDRFRRLRRPEAALDAYLQEILAEACRRGYRFDRSKLRHVARARRPVPESRGQLLHEWAHLLAKLRERDPARYRALSALTAPRPHPLFHVVPGGVRAWERGTTPRRRRAPRRPGAGKP